jgi:hypothetical protein
MNLLSCLFFLGLLADLQGQILIPLKVKDRKDLSEIQLTQIGNFGLQRKARNTIPAHLHTGIDIKRPGTNYSNEPVFPLAKGRVISIRRDGPFAQIIIEHHFKDLVFWTLYEHVSEIKVKVNQDVDSMYPIARYMNKNELDKYGWQFDHFHLEIFKTKPKAIKPDKEHSERYFGSYSLICFQKKDLEKYYYNPLEFISINIKRL